MMSQPSVLVKVSRDRRSGRHEPPGPPPDYYRGSCSPGSDSSAAGVSFSRAGATEPVSIGWVGTASRGAFRLGLRICWVGADTADSGASGAGTGAGVGTGTDALRYCVG